MSKERVLVYLGAYEGNSLASLVGKFDRIYAFEANPDTVEKLKQRFADVQHVTIVWGAVSEEEGWITFNVSSYDGASSMGNFNADFLKDRTDGLHMNQSIRVPSINLNKFCQEAKIEQIDLYVSDIQGADLMVLRTMERPYLAKGWIKSIQTETAKDGKHNIYTDLPTNELAAFKKLLEPYHYKLAATGWGCLSAGQFDTVPNDWWEFDALWLLSAPINIVTVPTTITTTTANTATTTAATLSAPKRALVWTSQLGQDRWVWENVCGRKMGGYYVDVGAHDGKSYSNTYVMEKELGWSGICIEPLPNMFAQLQVCRPKSTNLELCAYDQDGVEVEFKVDQVNADQMLSGIAQDIDHHQVTGHVITRKCMTLTTLLRMHNAPNKIDFLSVDTEGSELKVLKGIDWNAYAFHAITLEHNYMEPKRTIMAEFLKSKGYTRAKSLDWDDVFTCNHWHTFTPSSSSTSNTTPSSTTTTTTAADKQVVVRRQLRSKEPPAVGGSGGNGGNGGNGGGGGWVYSEVMGGLGNQLYMIAAALEYGLLTGRSCVFRRKWATVELRPPYWASLFMDLPQLSDQQWESKTKNAVPYVDLKPGYRTIPDYKDKPDVLVGGYFQSPKYFDLLRVKDRLFPKPLQTYAQRILQDTLSGFSASVAFMHFRRGDYKGLQHAHNILPMSYYERASGEFASNIRFLVFAEAEDMQAIQKEIAQSAVLSKRHIMYVDVRIPDYIQLLMMAHCPEGGIVANSSFSAWAAYLHPISNTIVAPTKWFANQQESTLADLCLPSWIRI
jgi:FkbM family methyltransferase